MTDKRTALAEVMNHPAWHAYINPGKHPECVELPDPEHSADDCEALIRFLNEQGYRIRIDWRVNRTVAFVEIWRAGTTNWKLGYYYDAVEKDDWKQGVVELAIKALELDDD